MGVAAGAVMRVRRETGTVFDVRISVIGCGYLGAVHAASMAKLGHEVVAVDVDPTKIQRLAAGEAPSSSRACPRS